MSQEECHFLIVRNLELTVIAVFLKISPHSAGNQLLLTITPHFLYRGNPNVFICLGRRLPHPLFQFSLVVGGSANVNS